MTSAWRLRTRRTTVAIVVLISVGDPQAAWVQALVGVTVAITVVSGPELKSRWVGESEERIRQIFVRARQSAPAAQSPSFEQAGSATGMQCPPRQKAFAPHSTRCPTAIP